MRRIIMNRTEYMSRLAELLADMPAEDREDALNYYNEYFDAGGPENEEANIASLGSPEDLARTIRLASSDAAVIDGEFTETGFSTKETDTRDVPDKYTQVAERDEDVSGKNKKIFGIDINGNNILLFIIIILIAGPVLFGVFGTVVGVLFGLISGLIGIIGGLFATAFSGVIGGVYGVVIAAFNIFHSPFGALTVLGFSLIGIALGLMLFSAAIWFCSKLLPMAVKWVIKAVKVVVGFIKSIFTGKESGSDE